MLDYGSSSIYCRYWSIKDISLTFKCCHAAFLTPETAIVGGLYRIWHNVYNSW